MKSVNILVTGIGGGGNGEQILKALRLARNPLYKLIGTDITHYTAGRRFIDTFCLLPPVTDPSYGQALFEVIAKYNIDFLFHGSEPELQFISQHRHLFREKGVKCYINSAELINLCSNKVETYERLRLLGFSVPRFVKIDSLSDINHIDFYPVVLKPYVGSGGSSNVFIALDHEEAVLLVGYMMKIGIRVVAQEYLASHEQEYTIGVSSDENGNLLGSIVVKKMIGNVLSTRLKVKNKDSVYVISSGFSQGEVCHMEDLQGQAERMALALNSKGPLNIQCRMVDGELMLMEINPRTSGTTSLRAMAGYNEPAMIIEYYLNNRKWNNEYKNMTILRGLEEYACQGLQVSVEVSPGIAEYIAAVSALEPLGIPEIGMETKIAEISSMVSSAYIAATASLEPLENSQLAVEPEITEISSMASCVAAGTSIKPLSVSPISVETEIADISPSNASTLNH